MNGDQPVWAEVFLSGHFMGGGGGTSLQILTLQLF
jgi:hypothetical protein